MSRIRGRDTGPEITLRRAMTAAGLRYRIHWRVPEAKVTIDIASPGRRIAIFVDGCFWHGCALHGVKPHANSAFWNAKLSGNHDRDMRQTAALRALGWRVIRLWEHDIEDPYPSMTRIAAAWADHIPADISAET